MINAPHACRRLVPFALGCVALAGLTAPAVAAALPATHQPPPASVDTTAATQIHAAAATKAAAAPAAGVTTMRGTFTSKHWPGRTIAWQAAKPAGKPKATVIVLHGISDDGAKAFRELQLAKQAARTGLALVTVDGGDHFWTSNGDVDTGRMVAEDLVRVLRARGLPVNRYAVAGYSMGGTGALLYAQRYPKKVFAVAPMSAAVWEGGKSGVEAKAQRLVRRDAAKLKGTPTRIVCGTGDSLIAVNRSLARQVPKSATAFTPGGHDFEYWRPALARQLDWLTKHIPRTV